MDASRLSLAGTVLSLLLSGPGGVVAAHDQPEASELGGSVLLDHTMPYLDLTDYGTIESSAGLTTMRGQVIEGVDVHAPGDPRLRGRAWVISNDDVYLDSQGAVSVGIAGIDNEDGSWRGPYYGYVTPDGRADTLALLTGDRAYEGLSAIMFVLDNGTGYDVHGMVYPGELPPAPEPPAE